MAMAENPGSLIMPADQYLAKRVAEGAPADEIEQITAMVRGEQGVGGNIMIDVRTGMVAEVRPGAARRPASPNPFRSQ